MKQDSTTFTVQNTTADLIARDTVSYNNAWFHTGLAPPPKWEWLCPYNNRQIHKTNWTDRWENNFHCTRLGQTPPCLLDECQLGHTNGHDLRSRQKIPKQVMASSILPTQSHIIFLNSLSSTGRWPIRKNQPDSWNNDTTHFSSRSFSWMGIQFANDPIQTEWIQELIHKRDSAPSHVWYEPPTPMGIDEAGFWS